jgi:hypothetical protein
MKESVFGAKRISLDQFNAEESKATGAEGLISDEEWGAHVDKVEKCSNQIVDVLENYSTAVSMDSLELVLKSGAKIMGTEAQDLLIRHLEEFHAELTILTLFNVLKKKAREEGDQHEESEGTTL